MDLAAVFVKELAIRCRDLNTGKLVSLLPSSRTPWQVVEGEILTIDVKDYPERRGLAQVSGNLLSRRIDAAALGIAPLELHEQGMWHPEDEYWGEEEDELDSRFMPIIEAGPRPLYEMEKLDWRADSDEFEDDPIFVAAELEDARKIREAYEIYEKLLTRDLRFLDVHAHLGNGAFAHGQMPDALDKAKRHYEVGVRIGELSLGPSFDGVLSWGLIYNRPFLRCLHGYGLTLWRLRDNDAAKEVFNRLLWLNPTDNQGVRYLLNAIEAGLNWEQLEKEDHGVRYQ